VNKLGEEKDKIITTIHRSLLSNWDQKNSPARNSTRVTEHQVGVNSIFYK
jgi:hypothetical protein